MPERKSFPPSPNRRPAGRTEQENAQWLRMIGVGFEFIAAVLLFMALGWWLDQRWGMQPWLMVAGLAIGFGVGLWLMIRSAIKTFHD